MLLPEEYLQPERSIHVGAVMKQGKLHEIGIRHLISSQLDNGVKLCNAGDGTMQAWRLHIAGYLRIHGLMAGLLDDLTGVCQPACCSSQLKAFLVVRHSIV